MKKIPTFPEPSDFDERVRKPGQAFLSSLDGTPLSHDFRGHSYWSRAHNQLHRLYAGICAYSSAWTPLPLPVNADNGHSSVDHFMPKTESPNVAYEWSNFRLARAYVNQAKGNSTDISDPTSVCDEWFQINFKTFRVITQNQSLRGGLRPTLTLINSRRLVDERANVIQTYIKGGACVVVRGREVSVYSF